MFPILNIYCRRTSIKKYGIIVLILTVVSASLWSRDGKVYWNSISADIGLRQIKDKNIHEKVHYGFLFDLQYGFWGTKHNIFALQAGLAFSPLKTQYEDYFASYNICFFISYFYDFKLPEVTIKNTSLGFYLGSYGGLFYSAAMYPNWDESHLYWADKAEIGIHAMALWKIGEKNRLLLTFQGLPVLSVISRPEPDRQYKMDDFSFSGVVKELHSNLEFASLNKNISVNLSLEYQRILKQTFALGFGYSFGYERMEASEGKVFHTIKHTAGIRVYL